MKTKRVLINSMLALVNVPFIILNVKLLLADELPADAIWHVCLLSWSVLIFGVCAGNAVIAWIDEIIE